MELERFETLRRRRRSRAWAAAPRWTRPPTRSSPTCGRCGRRRSPIPTSGRRSWRGGPRASSSTRSSATASRATGRRTKRKGRRSPRRSASRSCRRSSRSTTIRRCRGWAAPTSTASTASTTRAWRRQRATLVVGRRAARASCSADRRRAASRSRTGTGGGRRGGRSCRARATWSSSRSGSSPSNELRELLRAEAKRQGKLYGLSFRDISGGFTNTAARRARRRSRCCRSSSTACGSTAVPTSWCAASIWSARRWRRCRASSPRPTTTRRSTATAAPSRASCPVSATSPSLLVQQIEVERRDKGSDKPPRAAGARSRAAAGADARAPVSAVTARRWLARDRRAGRRWRAGRRDARGADSLAKPAATPAARGAASTPTTRASRRWRTSSRAR